MCSLCDTRKTTSIKSKETMNDMQKRVANWMKNFGQECPPTPVVPSLEVRKLRAKLILEEALETIEGMGIGVIVQDIDDRERVIMGHCTYEFTDNVSENITETSDGIADLLVVTLGTAVAHGIDIAPIFKEVMRSNDSKLWTRAEVIYYTMKGQDNPYTFKCVHKDCNGEEPCPAEPNEHCILTKDEHGKVIKSPSYSPPNILPLLKEQGLV